MGIGVELLYRLEQSDQEVGVQMSNLAQPASEQNTISVAWTMGLLLIDSVVYMIIAWYYDVVRLLILTV